MGFVARYLGQCGSCEEEIKPGQEITYDEGDQTVHVDCDAAAPVERPVTLCPTCHLTKPCDCEEN